MQPHSTLPGLSHCASSVLVLLGPVALLAAVLSAVFLVHPLPFLGIPSPRVATCSPLPRSTKLLGICGVRLGSRGESTSQDHRKDPRARIEPEFSRQMFASEIRG